MTNFYLVLFYTTLIMLSRQVQPGRPLCLERGCGVGGVGAALDLEPHTRHSPFRTFCSRGQGS